MDKFTGTQGMSASHRFEVAALEAYLFEHLDGFRGPLAVEQFKGGQSNPTYRLMSPGGAYVLRSKPGPVARLLPSAHAIEREFRVMSALQGSAVPVAKMHLLCEDESVIGRAFYVMECVEGRVLWEQALPGMPPAERGCIYDEMNCVISALHNIQPHAVGLSDFGKPGNYFERQIGRWSKQYLASATAPNPSMDALLDWLPAHIPASARDPSQVSIVHGDFRLDNMILAFDKPRVLAVLDWELSTLGHPLADFSYHCLTWHIPPGVFRGIAGLDHPALGIPTEASYLRRYCERTGRLTAGAADALAADWNFYLAYNLFRLAAICQGIAKRFLDGTASSAQARASGEAAPALSALAWQYAQRA